MLYLEGFILLRKGSISLYFWKRICQALRQGDLEAARHRVGMMVGRDTESLDKAGVTRSAVESLGENLVDGVTAPQLFALCFGPTGMMVFKAISTMDSLFGYRDARYRRFGAVPAKADDVAVFLPARATALLMPLAARLAGPDGDRCWRIVRRDRLAHASPNAGHGEAGMAGALGVQRGGCNTYGGVLSRNPLIGDSLYPIEPAQIRRAGRLVLATSLLTTLIYLGLAVLFK